MVRFDPHGDGTDHRAWEASFAETPPAPLDLAPYAHVVVVAPHPDDESLGAGGLIALCAARGIPLEVVIVTDGAASHPASPTHDPARLRDLRRAETDRAIAQLAPGLVARHLDVPDGMPAASLPSVEAVLRELLHAGDLLVSPFRGDGHHDHRVIGELCAAVAIDTAGDLAEYPIWYWHHGSPGDGGLPGTVVELALAADVLAAKHAAIHQHATQVAPLGPERGNEALLTPAFLSHFEHGAERYVLTQHTTRTLPAAYFDDVYARSADPWRFTTRRYEARKRAITLAALPLEHYGRVLEIGCSIGVLTEQLAPRCAELVAVDISATAVDAARQRTEQCANVRVEQRDVTAGLPDGPFDLVMLSEVGYYLSTAALAELATRIRAQLRGSGTVLACHWRHPVADYPLTGDTVHDTLRTALALERTVEHRERDFLIEVFEERPRSLAQVEGLAP